MLPCPRGNFPQSEHASTTSHQVDIALAYYLSNGIALLGCVFNIKSLLLLSFVALDYTLLYSSSQCLAFGKQLELCLGWKWCIGRPGEG